MKNLPLILLALFGCTKPKSNIYIVKAGRHYCKHTITVIKDSQISFTFEVNNTWRWDPYQELSKVCGLSWGDPKKNSIRLAVRSTEGGPTLYAMATIEGKIKTRELFTAKNGMYNCQIWYNTGIFYLICNEYFATFEAKTGLKKAEICYPYIGGDYIIDHDWVVPIEFN